MNIELTLFLGGKLKVYQPKKGFRFGIDSVILAYFLNLKPFQKILEVGAGSGIISLIALTRFSRCKIWALEREPTFIECLKKNVLLNNFKERFFIITGDFSLPPFKFESFDVLFSNPPYFEAGRGRESPYEEKNRACREKNLDLEGFIKKTSQLLKNRGNLFLVFTAYRMAELIYLLKKYRLEPKTLRLVHSYPGKEARLVLIRAVKNGGKELRILPPLYIYQKPKGDYTEEIKKFLFPS